MNIFTTKCGKKVFYNVFLTICICMLLAGCAGKNNEAGGNSDTPMSDYDNSDNSGATGASGKTMLPEPEIIYEDAEITLPAGLVGEEVSDADISNIDEEAETVTYSLSGNERSEILTELADDINNSISVILADKDHYPNITAITPNDDYTEFTIALEGGTFNTYESMLSMSFYIIGNKYQMYNGVSDTDAITVVRYVDSATGDVISEMDSSAMN
ncbi:MAG: hypothetical protein NC433_07915 [Clostridiales bacterium]|nr:hypothetical protein [Clostridiales bacterium]